VLDEVVLRRPGFSPGTTARLADGQDWILPGTACPGCCGDEYEALLEAIREAGGAAERLRAELALAIYLLECNYHLTPAGYDAILVGSADVASLRQMQESFRGVAAAHVEQRLARELRPAGGGRPAKGRKSLRRMFGLIPPAE
jgi:hypothetical protein